MVNERCSGCGVELPAVTGPVHRYIESSPSCWAAYGQVLAREYSDRAYLAAHRLTVDAYAAQHPGRPSPQSIQSVAVHLISLHAVLERQLPHPAATQLVRRCVDRMHFHWLDPPPQRGYLTVSSVLAARSPEEHVHAVDRWARSVWQAWCMHHAQLLEWAEQAMKQ